MLSKRIIVGLAAVMAMAPFAVQAKEFTQADLERIGKQLEAIAPKDPKLVYPVKYVLVVDKSVNAAATWEKDGENKRAYVECNTGLADYVKGDEKMIRAVLAHEFAHLGLGHCTSGVPRADELSNLWTRQQEMAADLQGAKFLMQLGYPKAEMVNMLLMLEELHSRTGQWFEKLSGDHPDPKMRAAEIADNNEILKSLLQFDMGLAFMDSRRWYQAIKFFDEAIALEPMLLEAYVNAGQSALCFYYDQLPYDVREAWLRPDFGPSLTNPSVKARATAINDQDLQRYKWAIAKLELAVTKTGFARAKELLALARMLEPNNDQAIIKKGMDETKALLDAASDPGLKLRYAANFCFGADRTNNLQAGYDAIMAAQKGTDRFNYALAENLGRIDVSNRPKDTEQLANDVLFTWLTRCPATAPKWSVVRSGYEKSCKALGVNPDDTKAPPTFLCKVVSLWFDNKELSLFRPVKEFTSDLGTPDATISLSKDYPDLNELQWKSGSVTVLTERGSILRVTTYQVGSSLYLFSEDPTNQFGNKLSVGMTVVEFKKTLDPATGILMNLSKGGKAEEWLYWPDLNMGVLISGDKVVALTVTPIDYARLPDDK